jgi:hypothetical protein
LEVGPRAKIGCLVVFLLVVGLFVGGSTIAVRHGEKSALLAAEQAYRLAEAADYAHMDKLVSKSGILTLQKAWAQNGKIDSWKVLGAKSQIFGRPTGVDVSVIRAGKEYVDVLALQDSIHVSVIVEFPKEDWKQKREDRAVRVIAP